MSEGGDEEGGEGGLTPKPFNPKTLRFYNSSLLSR